MERFISRIPGAALAHSDGWIVEGAEPPPDLRQRPSYFSCRAPAHGDQAYLTYLSNPVLTSSVMIERKAFFEAGGFDETFRVNEDADLLLRIMLSGGETIFVPKPLMVQRCFPGGLGRDQVRYLESSAALLDKARGMFPEHGGVLGATLSNTHKAAAWYAMRDGRGEEARRHWELAMRNSSPGAKERLTALLLGLDGPGLALSRKLWSRFISLLR